MENKNINSSSQLTELEKQLSEQVWIYSTTKNTIKANQANFEMMILMEKILKLKNINKKYYDTKNKKRN